MSAKANPSQSHTTYSNSTQLKACYYTQLHATQPNPTQLSSSDNYCNLLQPAMVQIRAPFSTATWDNVLQSLLDLLICYWCVVELPVCTSNSLKRLSRAVYHKWIHTIKMLFNYLQDGQRKCWPWVWKSFARHILQKVCPQAGRTTGWCVCWSMSSSHTPHATLAVPFVLAMFFLFSSASVSRGTCRRSGSEFCPGTTLSSL